MKGHQPCEYALATAAFAVQKSIPIVMGAPSMLYAEHAVFAIMQKAKTSLTTQRVTVSPATFFAHPILNPEEDEHDSVTHSLNKCSPAIEDPIPESVVNFVDGSSMIDQKTGIRHMGAAVVRARQNSSLDTLQVIEPLTLLAHFLGQAAELTALIVSLESGKIITLYSDSAYGTTMVHSSIMRWSGRGFLKSVGSPVMHRKLLEALIEALAVPQAVVVIKCVAHTNGQDFMSQDNELADQAANDAARHTSPKVPSDPQTAPVLVAQTALPKEPKAKTTIDQDTPHYTESGRLHLRGLQEAAWLH
ncbi:hypothetical protein NDU88_005331 [Pleurodeles waltl]|uniref:RNase H type-1 domain-containing protein n=1 Tax=Pleurodeles waltl TaxID=8319 RepID=A0AAV7TBY1_PLEWA|nr:hypothetical protein NDU88_005331 [Pleurodeles waltl]